MSEGKNVYEEALKKWGEPLQIDIAIEEMSELTKALIKDRRNSNAETVLNVLEEMADVEIMLTQLKYVFGSNRIFMDKKLARLARMLED